MSEDFLGTGWGFPIVPDPAGGLRYASGDDSIRDCLLALLLTGLGERVMRPDLGTSAPTLVFAPGSTANLRAGGLDPRRGPRFEPRVQLDDVGAETIPGDESRVIVSVIYRVRRTNTKANLVFPYYLERGRVAR